ncbi:unnamed protein product [Schistosoma mattheei]|uniref:TGF-beta family profile domain-containing protein n=1 Tax=Schistosoma mattheei TaxID=31246 RepID=A0AA85C2D5_9TREM|nr:unnamed protein product [Schistosoma mattheei]
MYNNLLYNIVYKRMIILRHHILLLLSSSSSMIFENSAFLSIQQFQYYIHSHIELLLKNFCNHFNIKIFIILLMIIIKSQLKYDLFHSMNLTVDASILTPTTTTTNTFKQYYHRPLRYYLQLSNEQKQSLRSYLYHSNHWLTQQMNNPFLSNIITNDHGVNPYDNENDKNPQFNNPQYNEKIQSIIEKFKNKILHQLHLKTVPKVNVNNESEWNSLPIILRNRLKAEIDVNNQFIDKPIGQDEEKETLILLKQYQPPVKLPNPNIFTLKVAEEIDPTHISRVTLHVEINGEIRPNSIFTLWEIHPTLFKPNFLWLNDINDNNNDNDDLTAESLPQTDINDYNEMENYQKFQSSNLFNDRYRLSTNDFQRMFKLIKPEIAKTIIPQKHLTSTITLNITNRMIHWLKYNHIKIQAYKPLIRYLMIMCNDCDNEQNIIDPKKVVMEIKYRPRLLRQRRSLTKGDETIYNVCRSNGHHYSCCTQPLSVKFSDIGWDNWIIHPKSFEPNYCRGSCKVTSTKSLHYDVMDLLLRKNLSQFGNIQRDDVQSCCHPTQLTSMSVLYLDSNRELQMHTLHNLIVLGCACS